MSDGTRYRCPKCGESDGLWEAVIVPGWRSLDAYLKPTCQRDFDWTEAERDSWASPEAGCSCGWEGSHAEFEAIGVDDKPLPAIHPDQQAIEVES